jgi:hypothetical protein
VTSATGIAVGQIVLGVGIAGGVNIPATISGQYPNSVAVTVVTGISGTTITLSSPTTAALSTTTLVFVASLVLGAGLVVMPRSAPIPLVIGSNTYLQAVSLNPQVGVQLNIAVGV